MRERYESASSFFPSKNVDFFYDISFVLYNNGVACDYLDDPPKQVAELTVTEAVARAVRLQHVSCRLDPAVVSGVVEQEHQWGIPATTTTKRKKVKQKVIKVDGVEKKLVLKGGDENL